MAAPSRARKLLIALGALALALGGAWLALQAAFPPQRIAQLVAEQVSSRTGRALRIEGPLDWRLLPRPAVVVEQLALANAPWGSQPQMLRIERAALQLSLWPLLQGRLHIDSVALQGVDLLLETDAKGVGNWNLPQPAPKPDGADKDSPGEAQEVGIDSVRLDDVRIDYRDGVGGQALAVVLQSLALDRNAEGMQLEAVASFQTQRWQASGRLGAPEQLLANTADWPLQLALRSDGVRIDLKGQVQQGAAPRIGRFDIDAGIDKPAALKPWLADATRVPLPVALKASVLLRTGSLQADPLRLSLAGQVLQGSASLRQGKPWQVQARLNADALDLARLAPPTAAARGAAAPARRQRLFGDEPLPIDSLPQGNATLELRIGRLLLPDAPPLSDLRAEARLVPGNLKVDPLAFGIAGGQMRGGVTLEAPGGSAVPRVRLNIDAAGLSAQALAHAAGAGSYVEAGRLRLKTELAMAGRSASALAGSADGDFLLSADDLRLGEGVSPFGTNLLPQLLRAITLQPQLDKSTQVQCAVMRLPLRGGVAKVDRSIAIETPDLAISAAGRIDLRDQTLELAFRPTPKHALGLNTAQLASLVMAKGPLLDPKLTLDAKGAAGLALSIGAAVASGGLSILGETLLRQTGDKQPCQTALTGAAAAPAATRPGTGAPPAGPAPSPQQALPGLLRELFRK